MVKNMRSNSQVALTAFTCVQMLIVLVYSVLVATRSQVIVLSGFVMTSNIFYEKLH